MTNYKYDKEKIWTKNIVVILISVLIVIKAFNETLKTNLIWKKLNFQG